MRTFLLLSFALACAGDTWAQAPAPAAAPPRAAPAPQRRAAAPAPARSGMAFTVTNPLGSTLAGVRVEAIGPSDRAGETNESGQIAFTAMQAGTYRVRFSGEHVVAFEREVALRAGQVAALDVTLTPASPPEPAPPPGPIPSAPTQAAPVGPVGQPQVASLVDLAEKELDSRQPRREIVVACSGNTRTTLVLLVQDQQPRIYETAESVYYVIAGQGTMRIADRDNALTAGVFASVPRGTSFSIARRGNRPLVLLATLSGAPCEEAR